MKIDSKILEMFQKNILIRIVSLMQTWTYVRRIPKELNNNQSESATTMIWLTDLILFIWLPMTIDFHAYSSFAAHRITIFPHFYLLGHISCHGRCDCLTTETTIIVTFTVTQFYVLHVNTLLQIYSNKNTEVNDSEAPRFTSYVALRAHKHAQTYGWPVASYLFWGPEAKCFLGQRGASDNEYSHYIFFKAVYGQLPHPPPGKDALQKVSLVFLLLYTRRPPSAHVG